MSESIDILIKADDQASKAFADVSGNLDKSMKRAAQIIKSLEEPTDRYLRQLDELKQLHADGALSAEQFADAEAKLAAKMTKVADDMVAANSKIEASTTSAADAVGKFKDTGKTTKSVSEFAGVLATLTGNSELAGFAGQMAGATEKISQFSEVQKSGKAGALGFQLGLVALAAGAGFAVGTMIANIVWQTEKFNREAEAAKNLAKELDDQLKQLAQNTFSEGRADIELIRNPEEKRAAYRELFSTLQTDIAQAAAVARKSKADAEEWADAWQITGNRKQYAEDAKNQAESDRERVNALKEQASEVGKLIGQRAIENEQIRAANDAKDKSSDYLDTLQKEVEYLKATREEQVKLDAARNTTAEDRGEAERLLKERDAILAKAEAEKELEQTRIRAEENAAKAAIKAQEEIEKARLKTIDEALRAAKKLQEDAENEQQRIKDIIASEQERNELQRIEIEQGKEAAKAQELMNKGVDEATAKKLAADAAAVEKLKQPAAKPEKEMKAPGVAPALTAMTSRLLSRGPQNKQDVFERILQAQYKTNETAKQSHSTQEAANEKLDGIEKNTDKVTLVWMPE